MSNSAGMNHICAEVLRTIRVIRSYWLEYISDFITYVIGFLLLIAVFIAASENFGPTGYLTSLIGYITWKMCASVMLDIANTPLEETRAGTLEQILLSGISPGRVLVSRVVGYVLDNGLRSMLMGVVLAILGGVFPVFSLLASGVLLLTLLGAVGMGFALAGFVLVERKTSRVPTLFWRILVFFTGALAPIHQPALTAIAKTLPLTWGISALRAICLDGANIASLWEKGLITGLLINTASYLLLGSLVFSWGYRQARTQGTLAHY